MMNVNIYAMLIHYFGDALSSVLVLASGLLMKYFPNSDWAPYVDPVASLFIVAIMLWTTIPLLIRCSKVLIQRVPNEIEIGTIKNQLLAVPGVLGVHELHVWPLVEEMIICSVHITCEEGSDFNAISKTFKHIFHEHGIHSTSVQPEFVPIHHQMTEFCEQNCVEDCEEDWCCRKSAEKTVVSKSPIVPRNNDELL
jgi:zinc transporter 1